MQKNARATEQKQETAHLSTIKADAVPEPVLPQPDLTSLARRLRHGDRAAAEELVDLYYARIHLLMRAMGYDRPTSEDLTQETFMRAWMHIGQLRDGKALTGWIFRIAGNVARLHWRKHRPIDPGVLEVDDDLVEGSEQAGGREEVGRLREAVSRLPLKLRQAIVLHYMDQLTIAEAADAAGIRQGTLKSRLSRALEVLRKRLEDQ